MTPTILGRIQTRVVFLLFIGSLVTLAIAGLLPGSAPLTDRYRNTFIVLAAVAVLGIGWEMVYHFVMQWRWEKDWPTIFGLVTVLPEGALIWWLLVVDGIPGIKGTVTAPAFGIHFAAVWLAVWMVGNSPIRVPFIRWRFRGGRFV